MGEHWVHPGLMVDGIMDATRPQALSYLLIDGEPVLTGVIFARPLAPGEPPPDFPHAGLPWHDHVGAIDEESVLLHHAMSAEGSGFRLSMLHAWIWTENPDGIFAADNWSLPFLRLGIAVPESIPVGAARALSLLAGGDRYHLMLLRALAGDAAVANARAEEILAELSEVTVRWVSEHGAARSTLRPDQLAMLDAAWVHAWHRIADGLPDETAARVRATLAGDGPRESGR